MSHPLDRPVWHALNGRLAHLAEGGPLALLFRPDVNILGAAADDSPEAAVALAALAVAGEPFGTVEGVKMLPPPGMTAVAERQLAQMVLERPPADWGTADWRGLDDADAVDMFELATMTRPGPWRTHSHLMGGFVGVNEGGRLLAMAGERMKLPGWTEVSGVCTHPGARGRGLATALMGVVIERVLARGEQAFLHTYADNHGAIALYRRLGFEIRREVTFTTWQL